MSGGTVTRPTALTTTTPPSSTGPAGTKPTKECMQANSQCCCCYCFRGGGGCGVVVVVVVTGRGEPCDLAHGH